MAETKKTTTVKKTPAAAPKAVAAKPVAPKAPAAAPKKVAPVAAAKPMVAKTATPKVSLKNANKVYATGKRKNSIARVYMAPGKGEVIVNGKKMDEYFKRSVMQMILGQPFEVANSKGIYDVVVYVSGGGLSGQAGAVKHGISKALAIINAEVRPALKKAGFLTRDSREVERKHYGFRKARRSTQFSKR